MDNKIIVFFIAVAFLFQSVKAEKRALIVAVANYPKESSWQTIHADNDVSIVKAGLQKQGFSEKNIAVLLDKQATKIGILNALDNLTKNTQPGDVIFLHFAGHGQQVTDISGDEIDGLDEAFVPYDSEKENKTGKTSADKHLIDDELNELILGLRKKAGKSGDVLVFVDACHSGTMERGSKNDIMRGTDTVYEIPNYKNGSKRSDNKSLYINSSQKSTNSGNLSPFIIISACAAEQTNTEYKDKNTGRYYGTLSYTIGILFSKSVENMSYTSFFELLKIKLHGLGEEYREGQTPQMEGDANRKVFAGNAVSIPNHFVIKEISSKNHTVIINGGSLAGIKTGAKVDFYPPDTYTIHTTKPIQTGTVIETGLVESKLELSSSAQEIDRKLWAFVSKYTFPKEREIEEKAQILREIQSSGKDVKLEIIPVDKTGKEQNPETKKRNGNIEFVYTDAFIVKIINNSKKPLYFQLINILPNDEIKLLTVAEIYDCYIVSGQSRSFQLEINPGTPTGLETIVLVASEEPLNLSPIETHRPNIHRNSQNEFEAFLNDLYSNERTYHHSFLNISIDSKNYYVKSK